MRRIEFIGWEVNGKGWVHGDLTHSKRILQQEPWLEDRIMVGGYEVYPDSVGQFTGAFLMEDGEAKDIYEGDIIFKNEDNDTDHIGKVIFRNGCFCIMTHNAYIPFNLLTDKDGEVRLPNSIKPEEMIFHELKLIRFPYEPEM